MEILRWRCEYFRADKTMEVVFSSLYRKTLQNTVNAAIYFAAYLKGTRGGGKSLRKVPILCLLLLLHLPPPQFALLCGNANLMVSGSGPPHLKQLGGILPSTSKNIQKSWRQSQLMGGNSINQNTVAIAAVQWDQRIYC